MTRRSHLGAAILVGFVVLASIPTGGVAVDETADREDVGVADQEPDGSLSRSQYVVTRGETVEITVSHSGPATLYVGDEDAGYRLRVNLSGSGTSTVEIDTYHSVDADPHTYVSGGDPTVLYPSDGLSRSLVPAAYTLNLTVDGIPQDLGQLVIEERPTMGVEAGIAPAEIDLGDTDASELASASTDRQTVARGDYAVFTINASGLGTAIDSDDLDGDGGANGIEIYVEDMQSPPNRAADSFYASERPAVTARWDEETSRLVLAWDTEDVELFEGEHQYNVSIRIRAAHNNLISEDSFEDDTTITVVEPRVSLESRGERSVYPWDNDVVTLRGTTNFAPGSTLEYRAQSFEPRPFLKKSRAEVSANGTFVAEMDLSDVEDGIEFPLWILGHRDLGEWTLAVREASAQFDFENQTAEDGRQAVVENVSLSVGGFLVLEDANGTTRGIATVGESEQSRVTVDLEPPLTRSAYLSATAYMDWNRNGSFEARIDRPYRTNRTDIANVTDVANETNETERAVVFVPETGEPRSAETENQTRTTTSTVENDSTSNAGTNGSSVDPETGNTSEQSANQTTASVTTFSVVDQEPLTPGTTEGEAPLSVAVPVFALALVVVFVARRVR